VGVGVSSLIEVGADVGGKATSVGVTVEEGSATEVLVGLRAAVGDGVVVSVAVATGSGLSVGSRVLLGTIVTPDLDVFVAFGSSVAVSGAFAVCVAVDFCEEPQATKRTSSTNRKMGIYVFIVSALKLFSIVGF
jgi:hypothetical protein